MNFSNFKAFINSLKVKDSNGQVKFAAIVYFLCKGDRSVSVEVQAVKELWTRGLLYGAYSPTCCTRAQADGYVDPSSKGEVILTTDGVELILNLSKLDPLTSKEVKKTGMLYIVNKKDTHSFDKFLRTILSRAKREVLVADSYINDKIFDNVLDEIPKDSIVKLIYNNIDDPQKFESRSKRFKTEHSKYEYKQYKDLHDRFIIVDSTGYVLGPSIKDAASNSPALVVQLGGKETVALTEFFKSIWKTI